MLKYITKRLITLIPIIFIVSFLVFWLMSLTGDPAAAMAGEYATAEDIELLRKEMGLDKPLIIRYAKYMWDLVHGDMGLTLYGNRVVDEFSARYPNTMRLAFVSMIFTTVFAVDVLTKSTDLAEPAVEIRISLLNFSIHAISWSK